MRVAAAAAGLAGALVLTACSGDGGSEDEASAAPSSPDTSASASAETGGGSGGSDGSGGSKAASDGLEGSWLATTDGKAVALVVTGSQAGLFATGGTVCSGTAREESGMEMIRLKCKDGSKDRASGMVDSVNGTTLRVTWEDGLGAETYTRAEGGKMPTGLPTGDLGS
ncbi:arginine/ornithine antiporter arcD [Streptomyces sp. NL15-2K]|nr:arginine/ornithine antiporter arcD [Streptomyces sp. NL15-2K]